MRLKKGEKYKIFFNDNNPNNMTIHIRGIIDKEYIVYKHWLKRKKMWSYSIEYLYYFELLEKDKALTKIK